MIDLSKLKSQLGGKPLAIVGLGKSGMPVYEACKKAGIDTVLWDDNEAARQTAIDAGAKVEDVTQGDFTRFAALCLSPGIPLTHPKPHAAVIRAQEAGVEILGDIELFHRAKPDAFTIGITGTNGKSTTTALIGHILKTAGVPSAVGGNIGEAVLTLPDLPAQDKKGKPVYVLELSSYQTDLCTTFAPNVAVFINISPDHLDRHGGVQGYVTAKEKIFKGPGVAIIGRDDAESENVHRRQKTSARRTVTGVYTTKADTGGIHVGMDGILFDRGGRVMDLNECPALKGKHNWQNAGMAYAACKAAGLDDAQIVEGLKTFPGLAHRQNIVTVFNGVAYVNDSKATNDQAAAMALRTFKPVYWIAGGKPKDGGYADCEKHLANVRHAFLIGEAQDSMAEWLESKGVAYTKCGTLDAATQAAHAMAQEEQLAKATVLLAPACASFDQFKNFEQRGDAFVETVHRLTHPQAVANKGPRP